MFEETTAVGDEAAEVPVEDECQVRDSNISKYIGSVLNHKFTFQMFIMQMTSTQPMQILSSSSS